jgi:microcystin-dependent protein
MRLAQDVDADICAIASTVERGLVGDLRMTIRQVADPGWALMGTTLTNADVNFPDFWAIAPVSWRSGSNLVLPSMADRVPTGVGAAAVGIPSGSNSRVITASQLPLHQHTIDHDHPSTLTGTENQNHAHTFNVNSGGVIDDTLQSVGLPPYDPSYEFIVQRAGGTGGIGPFNGGKTVVGMATTYPIEVGLAPQHVHNVNGGTSYENAAHNHWLDLPLFTGLSGNGGFANAPLDIRQQSLAVVFQIRVLP